MEKCFGQGNSNLHVNGYISIRSLWDRANHRESLPNLFPLPVYDYFGIGMLDRFRRGLEFCRDSLSFGAGCRNPIGVGLFCPDIF